jgi:hypothetical protein
MGSRVIWYTFVAIAIYLLLTKWQGANALLRSGSAGYVSIVRALQGR